MKYYNKPTTSSRMKYYSEKFNNKTFLITNLLKKNLFVENCYLAPGPKTLGELANDLSSLLQRESQYLL